MTQQIPFLKCISRFQIQCRKVICISMFAAPLLTIAQNWKQPKCAVTYDSIKNCGTHTQQNARPLPGTGTGLQKAGYPSGRSSKRNKGQERSIKDHQLFPTLPSRQPLLQQTLPQVESPTWGNLGEALEKSTWTKKARGICCPSPYAACAHVLLPTTYGTWAQALSLSPLLWGYFHAFLWCQDVYQGPLSTLENWYYLAIRKDEGMECATHGWICRAACQVKLFKGKEAEEADTEKSLSDVGYKAT